MKEDRILVAVQSKLGVQFQNPQLLLQALTHKSYAIENSSKLDFERLELLGDALLDFLVLEYLMQVYTEDSEGQLSKKRSSLVNQAILETICREMELGPWIRLSRSEVKSGGFEKSSILSSVVEAILGAVYLDQGLLVARRLVKKWFDKRIFQEELFRLDFKTEFQEKIQSKLRITPTYRELDEKRGQDFEFRVGVFVGEQQWAEATGKSKKEAEQRAAAIALEKLKNEL